MNYTKILIISVFLIGAYLIYLDIKNYSQPKKVVITELKIDTLVKYKEIVKTRLKSKLDTLYSIKNDTTIILNDCKDSVEHYEDLISYYEPALTDALQVIETQDSIISLKDTVITEIKKKPKQKIKVWQIVGLVGVGIVTGKALSK